LPYKAKAQTVTKNVDLSRASLSMHGIIFLLINMEVSILDSSPERSKQINTIGYDRLMLTDIASD
jgi:hypothetical protein